MRLGPVHSVMAVICGSLTHRGNQAIHARHPGADCCVDQRATIIDGNGELIFVMAGLDPAIHVPHPTYILGV